MANEDLPDSLKEMDVEVPDEDFEVEVVDEEPTEPEVADEGDEEEPAEEEAAESDDSDDDGEEEAAEDEPEEEKSLSKQIKARLARQRRKAEEEIAAVKDQATRYIRSVSGERDALQKQHADLQDSYVALLESSLEEKAERLQKDFRAAKEALDSDAEIKALSELQTVALQKSQLSEIARDIKAKKVVRTEAPVQQQREVAKPTAKGEQWIAKRKWFGKTDKEDHADATVYAYEIDKRLVKEGYNPNSDEYFKQLDIRLSKRFPELYADKPKSGKTGATAARTAPVGQGATRSKSSSGKTVRLVRSDLETMRMVGLDPNNKAHLKAFAAQKRG